MKILIVCSFNSGKVSPFVKEQVESLKQVGIDFDYFKIQGKGILGYLKNLNSLKRTIRDGEYDLVHAHYGLSALLANFQRIIPVIASFHGSDINKPVNNVLSSFASKLSRWTICVSENLFNKLYLKSTNYSIIPCGINLDEMISMPQREARDKLGMEANKNYILFSSSFSRPVKNSKLAKRSVQKLDYDAELVELKGYSRQEVVWLMNACDLLLMTSFTEGSPQVIKEAMACNTPVVSTNVGDVKELIQNTTNCYLVEYDAEDVASKINIVLDKGGKTDGRNTVKKYDNDSIASKIKEVYKKVCGNPK